MFRVRPLASGGEDWVRAWCIDTAGHHTSAAYEFCRPRYRVPTPDGRRLYVFPTIGRAGPGPLWPRQPSRQNKAKILLWPLRVDAGKEALYTRLAKVAVAGPGYIHFPHWFGEPYFLQIASEEIVHGFDQRGFPTRTWQLRSPGRRNEALDTWVLSYAALCGLIQHGFDLASESRDLARRRARLSDSPGPESSSRPADRDRSDLLGNLELGAEGLDMPPGARENPVEGVFPELAVEATSEAARTQVRKPLLQRSATRGRRRRASRFITGGW